MVVFRIEIAGIPVEIRCRFSENRTFFRDYLTEKEPVLSIEPTDADLTRMLDLIERRDEKEGTHSVPADDVFLENNAIHALLAEQVIWHDVLMIHGSALRMDGEAVLFVAPSGTGKSTHAQLWRLMYGKRVWMINDDKPMIRIGDEIRVYGTPWDGKHHLSENISAPLRAVVWLVRSEKNRIQPMSRSEAFPILMNQAYESKHLSVMKKIIELEKKLLETVDFYKLECNPDLEAAGIAWKGIWESHNGKKV